MGDAVILIIAFVIAAALYLGCGALFHWALIGDAMSISSAGTWGIMIAWPLIALAIYLAGMLVLYIFGFVAIAGSRIEWKRAVK